MNETKRTILVAEDDPGIQSQMRWALDDFDAHVVGDRQEALAVVRKENPKVLVLDLGMPPDEAGVSEGLATLEETLKINPNTKVIVASGNSERANAVEAIRLGAYDFCSKPVDIDILMLIIDRAFELYDLETENQRLSEAQITEPFEGVIASSPGMLKLCKGIEKVAGADVSVLFTGESGTGKEVMAKALHRLSNRAKEPFVAINCAAIPENLLESELFGHEKGAFTGAVQQQIGKVEGADGGTLFLDEIGDMPLSLQSKMLRFLQEHQFERVGGRKTHQVDVRIVSATNMDLEIAIDDGRFREDLFYRLNELAFHIPPLREREGDRTLLAKFYLSRYSGTYHKKNRGFSDEGLMAIEAYRWPGNVRELENKVKRAVVMSDEQPIEPDDLDLEVSEEEVVFPTLRQVRERAEIELINRALVVCDDNVSQAAKLLGVSRPTLYELMKSLGMKT
jgi:two-component system, NtrC family, response regulator